MPNYKIFASETVYYTIDIEAEDQDDAHQQVYDMDDFSEYEDGRENFEINDYELIESQEEIEKRRKKEMREFKKSMEPLMSKIEDSNDLDMRTIIKKESKEYMKDYTIIKGIDKKRLKNSSLNRILEEEIKKTKDTNSNTIILNSFIDKKPSNKHVKAIVVIKARI